MSLKMRLSELAYSGSNIAKRLTNYLLFIVIAREYSLFVVGEYSSYINIISVLLLITNFGYNEYISIQTKEDLSKQFTVLTLLSFLTLIFIVIISSIFPINNKLLFSLLIIKLFLETTVSLIQLAYFQVVNKIYLVTISNYLISILTTIVIGLNTFYKFEINILVLLIVLISTISILFVFKFVDFNRLSIKQFISELIITLKNLKYFGLVALTVPLYMAGPNIIASFMIPKEELAVYQVAFSLSNVILLLSISSIQSSFPKILESRFDTVRMGEFLKQLSIKIIVLNLIILFVALFISNWGIAMLVKNNAYAGASKHLYILLGANMLQSISSIAAITLIVYGQQKKKFFIQIELVTLSWVGGWLCINFLKESGIAIAYIILYAYGLIRYGCYSYSFFNK